MPTITGVSHVDLTVTDLDVSEEWYAELFTLRRVLDGRNDEHGFSSRYLLHPDSLFVLGLVVHDQPDAKEFDEHRVGLDHLSLSVDGVDELIAWEERLAALGIDHSPIAVGDLWDVLVFRDPDNIQLELFHLKPEASSLLSG